MPTRLTFHEVTVSGTGLHIGRMEVIDEVSGESLRVAKVSDELCRFLESVEIDVNAWYEIEKLREKNPAVTKLIQTFRLFT
jgi:hypothetical protein